jgi:hypothetical protein
MLPYVFSLLVAQPAATQLASGRALDGRGGAPPHRRALWDLTTVVDGAIPDQVEVPTVNESGDAGICSYDFTITDMVAHLEAPRATSTLSSEPMSLSLSASGRMLASARGWPT